MPWLLKDGESADGKLFFVHVPRCGGTSLTKLFKVEQKARKATDLYHKIGQLYFFYRYRLLEKSNFAFVSFENLYALIVFTTAWIVYFADSHWGIPACREDRWCPPPLSISFWACSLVTFVASTFIMTASIMGRREFVRRFCLLVFGKYLWGFGGAPEYLHGVNYDGYLMHYTAEKLLRKRFVKADDLEDAFAIVRNPLSRMVSIYRYNTHPFESFAQFVDVWSKKLDVYKSTGNTEEWDVYCHVLPMHAFTHFCGHQLVPHVIKQEDLKIIKRRDGSQTDLYQSRYKNLPSKVVRALCDMPHTNKRSTAQPWYALYDQATLDKVIDMYAMDFVTFGYETNIPKRDDLVPSQTLEQLRAKFMSGNFVKHDEGARRPGAGNKDSRSSSGQPQESPESVVVVFDDSVFSGDMCDTGSSVSSLSARSSTSDCAQRPQGTGTEADGPTYREDSDLSGHEPDAPVDEARSDVDNVTGSSSSSSSSNNSNNNNHSTTNASEEIHADRPEDDGKPEEGALSLV